MDSSATAKKQQREFFISLRHSIQEPRISAASLAVAAFVRELPKGSFVLSFLPFRGEINVNLANRILVEEFSLALPQIDNNELSPVHIPTIEVLSELSHPLHLPQFNLEFVSPERITHVLVPALAFDNEGYRLGYGGGYYDRWLAMHPHLLTIGVGYLEQKTEVLPKEPHDIPVAKIFLC
ncbi:5-formyltetrahydrofolate cyclo-ligase [Chlamydia vaughanii]|uniref:5-formyltetrahydrofolate cyclo-ligase n=1 Tax=Chlamydia vaughanii TaxID=3112552 RepID=UPI0032B1EC15